MKVAHFVESFSPLSETFVYDYIQGLEKEGVDNYVVTLVRHHEIERPFAKVKTLTLQKKYHPKRWLRKFKVLSGLLAEEEIYHDWYRDQLYAHLQAIQPDVLHAQFGPSGVLLAPVAKQLNIPLVVTFHGYDFSVLMKEPYWYQQYQSLFAQVALLIGVSNYVCHKLTEAGASKKKLIKIYNAIDTKKFSVLCDGEKKDKHHIVCVHVGRLVEKKDPITLLKAFSLCLREIDDTYQLSLVIVGDGPLLSEVKSLISSLHMEKSVELILGLAHDDIPQLLQKADIYTQHSVTASNGDEEGMGISFAEASMMGLPVVATLHNGIPEVILDGETGLLVAEKDTRAMADSMLKLCYDETLRNSLGQAGIKHITQHFSQAEYIKKHMIAFENILVQGGR
ncbi:MAG: glycosyltransferase [Mariprofundaceae bacterium]|nr:glycosyltransferase [Mariprofundaceae bacterium]